MSLMNYQIQASPWDSGLWAYEIEQQIEGDLWRDRLALAMETSVETLVLSLAKIMKDRWKGAVIETRTAISGDQFVVAYSSEKSVVMLARVACYNITGPFITMRGNFHITMASTASSVRYVMDTLKNTLTGHGLAEVTWWYRAGNGVERNEIIIEPPKPVHSLFYPFIKGGIHDYFTRYIASESSILLMLGEPGTGKTSLLRWFLHEFKLKTMITYDEGLLSSDAFFVSFMTGEHEVIVIEDADEMLKNREHDGNKLMARLLAASDGLIKPKLKKIVFTTNLDTKGIDAALVRPGRCFDVLEFRALDADEARAAAIVAGLSRPIHGCTLAELFNPAPPKMPANAKVGF